MNEEKIRIDPPLHLASTTICCWRCGAEMPAVALLAPNVPDTEGEICILSNIQDLPPWVLTWIQKRFPTFRLKYSKTTRSRYYANTCPDCGVLSGDFYLHEEPGAPFFPTTKEEARSLAIEMVPMRESILVRTGLGMGTVDLILENAGKIGRE
jgi:hypothetical protein